MFSVARPHSHVVSPLKYEQLLVEAKSTYFTNKVKESKDDPKALFRLVSFLEDTILFLQVSSFFFILCTFPFFRKYTLHV